MQSQSPFFVISAGLMFIDFNILWRYFNWANQATAVIALFVSAAYLMLKDKEYLSALIPGILMLYMVILYLLTEQIGFGLPMQVSYYISAVAVGIIVFIFIRYVNTVKEETNPNSDLLNDQKSIETLYPELVDQYR